MKLYRRILQLSFFSLHLSLFALSSEPPSHIKLHHTYMQALKGHTEYLSFLYSCSDSRTSVYTIRYLTLKSFKSFKEGFLTELGDKELDTEDLITAWGLYFKTSLETQNPKAHNPDSSLNEKVEKLVQANVEFLRKYLNHTESLSVKNIASKIDFEEKARIKRPHLSHSINFIQWARAQKSERNKDCLLFSKISKSVKENHLLSFDIQTGFLSITSSRETALLRFNEHIRNYSENSLSPLVQAEKASEKNKTAPLQKDIQKVDAEKTVATVLEESDPEEKESSILEQKIERILARNKDQKLASFLRGPRKASVPMRISGRNPLREVVDIYLEGHESLPCPEIPEDFRVCAHHPDFWNIGPFVMGAGHNDAYFGSNRDLAFEQVNEGWMNMFVLYVVTRLMPQCFPYNHQTGTGFLPPVPTRFPGERSYNQWISDDIAFNKTWDSKATMMFSNGALPTVWQASKRCEECAPPEITEETEKKKDSKPEPQKLSKLFKRIFALPFKHKGKTVELPPQFLEAREKIDHFVGKGRKSLYFEFHNDDLSEKIWQHKKIFVYQNHIYRPQNLSSLMQLESDYDAYLSLNNFQWQPNKFYSKKSPFKASFLLDNMINRIPEKASQGITDKSHPGDLPAIYTNPQDHLNSEEKKIAKVIQGIEESLSTSIYLLAQKKFLKHYLVKNVEHLKRFYQKKSIDDVLVSKVSSAIKSASFRKKYSMQKLAYAMIDPLIEVNKKAVLGTQKLTDFIDFQRDIFHGRRIKGVFYEDYWWDHLNQKLGKYFNEYFPKNLPIEYTAPFLVHKETVIPQRYGTLTVNILKPLHSNKRTESGGRRNFKVADYLLLGESKYMNGIAAGKRVKKLRNPGSHSIMRVRISKPDSELWNNFDHWTDERIKAYSDRVYPESNKYKGENNKDFWSLQFVKDDDEGPYFFAGPVIPDSEGKVDENSERGYAYTEEDIDEALAYVWGFAKGFQCPKGF